MASIPILPHFFDLKQLGQGLVRRLSGRHQPIQLASQSPLNQEPDRFPAFGRHSPVAMRYWRLLSPLAWDRFPERDLRRNWGQPCVPMAPFAAACLIKLDLGLRYMSQLRTYLVDHPALIWVLGFPRVASSCHPWGFDPEASLPTARHFTRLLRKSANARFQFLLDDTVRLLQAELAPLGLDFGQAISLDTKHIVAWIREVRRKVTY